MSVSDSTSAQKILTGLGFLPVIGTAAGVAEITVNLVALKKIQAPQTLFTQELDKSKVTRFQNSTLAKCETIPPEKIGTTQTEYAALFGSHLSDFLLGNEIHETNFNKEGSTSIQDFSKSLKTMKEQSIAYLQSAAFSPKEKKERIKFVTAFLDALDNRAQSYTTQHELDEVNKEDVNRILISIYEDVSYLEDKEKVLQGVVSGALRLSPFTNLINLIDLRKNSFSRWKVSDQL